VISLVVANATTLFKNHLPDLDMEILYKDFTIDDAEREALANSAYDASHKFVSLYNFSSLAESDDNNSPRASSFFYLCCNEPWLVYKFFDLISLNTWWK
jgi:hypothetical protein